jgi:hypothetical protein
MPLLPQSHSCQAGQTEDECGQGRPTKINFQSLTMHGVKERLRCKIQAIGTWKKKEQHLETKYNIVLTGLTAVQWRLQRQFRCRGLHRFRSRHLDSFN